MRFFKFLSLLLIVGALSYFLNSQFTNAESKDLPKLGKFKRANLETLDGQVFTGAELIGKVSAMNFFFTSCGKICPMSMRRISKVQKDFENDASIKFVSISVDPKRDTKEKLKKYAQSLEANNDNWPYLRGEKSEIARILTEELNIASSDSPDFHTTRIALIDQQLNIRGYYDSLSAEDLEKLRTDILNLKKEIS